MAQVVTDFERSLIGTILMAPPRQMPAAVSGGIKAEWFTDDGWSLMWSALVNFWTRGEIEQATPINVRAEALRLAAREKERRVADSLTVAAVEKAIDDAGVGPIDATVRLLRNCDLERSAKKAVSDSMARIETWADYTDGIAELRDELDKILGGTFSTKKILPRAIFAEIMGEYEEAWHMRVDPNGPRNLKWTPGIKMPWPKMTEFMNGLRPGLHVVAARPSVGKTAFAVNLMHFWLETGTPVVFCSLDMQTREVLRRYIAEKARVSARKAAFSPTAADLDAMRKAVAQMSDWPLSVVEICDVDELRTFCMVEKSAGRLGVLVVDYLQLLHARSLGREDAVEYARISHVSDTLKRIANELALPVIALAQLNREVTKQEAQGRLPGLADLRGSGSIEQDAYTVTILHRDEPVAAKWRKGEDDLVKRLIPGTLDNPSYKYNADDLDPIWWILCKAQNGPTGRLPFVVRKKYFAWMLGDFEAQPETTATGYGATARTVVDNSPFFHRVHADWRHDPLEAVLRNQLALIESPDDVANFAD